MTNCNSCNGDLTPALRRGVPAAVDCCLRCWKKVPVHERLKLMLAIRDREIGGVLNEMASAAATFVDIKDKIIEDDD